MAAQDAPADTTRQANAPDTSAFIADSVHISLLTCSPHQAVYSLYGHTALRFEDRHRGIDLAINYGVFNFDKPFFTLRFVFGLTDYEMGTLPFDAFCREYAYYGSEVHQQEINLTAAEKRAIAEALEENAKPENVVYRYNYFYDNCTTRARNMITDHIKGGVDYGVKVPEGETFRKMIHSKTAGHPWAQLGNDLLLGLKADRQVNAEDYMFLPEWTLSAFAMAERKDNGAPLVGQTTTVVEGSLQTIEPEFPLTPVQCAILVFAISFIATLTEWRIRRQMWIVDAVFMLLQGICGLVLTAMIFSQHPTVSLNIQLLIFNPLPLIFGYHAIRRQLKNEGHWLWMSQIVLTAFFFVLMSFGVQWIDASVQIVACALLLRYSVKLFYSKQKSHS